MAATTPIDAASIERRAHIVPERCSATCARPAARARARSESSTRPLHTGLPEMIIKWTANRARETKPNMPPEWTANQAPSGRSTRGASSKQAHAASGRLTAKRTRTRMPRGRCNNACGLFQAYQVCHIIGKKIRVRAHEKGRCVTVCARARQLRCGSHRVATTNTDIHSSAFTHSTTRSSTTSRMTQWV